jgi:DNA-binding transcriptional LysR family regulator
MLAARIPGFRPVFAADDYIVQLRAAEAGAGAVLLGRFASRFSLPTPLVEFPLPEGGFKWPAYLTCAPSSLAVPRVRAVADVIAAEFALATSAPNARSASPPGGNRRRASQKAR